jgi:hypothetical protein
MEHGRCPEHDRMVTAIYGDGTDSNPGVIRKMDLILNWIEGRKNFESKVATAMITLAVSSVGSFVFLAVKLLLDHKKP